jgi:hypothetical protein
MRSITQLVGVALTPSHVHIDLFCKCSTTALMSGYWMFSGFSARRSVRFRITTEDIRNDASSVCRVLVRKGLVRDRMAEKLRIEADSGFQV